MRNHGENYPAKRQLLAGGSPWDGNCWFKIYFKYILNLIQEEVHPGLSGPRCISRNKGRIPLGNRLFLLFYITLAASFSLTLVYREQMALQMLKYEREVERRRQETRARRHQALVQNQILHELQEDFMHNIVEPVCGLMNIRM